MENGEPTTQLREELDRLWSVLRHLDKANDHREAAQRFRAQAEEASRQTDQLRAEIQSMIKGVHEESAKYVNAIAVIGYAGYFATWSFSKDILARDTASFVGLMGMISISLFVLWEMWIVFAVRLKGVGDMNRILRDLISYEDFGPLKREYQAAEAKRIAILAPIHRLVFATSALTAVAGGAVMMIALYANI